MRLLPIFCLVLSAWGATAAEVLRVGVVGNAPPMSYATTGGQLTGFNVELARALCEALAVRCAFKPYPLNDVVDMVAKDQVDFAVVSLLVTPERRAKVLFTKPLYRALSVWVSGQPFPGASPPSSAVAVVQGSVQHTFGQDKSWPMAVLATHAEVGNALMGGRVQAALLPMTTGMNVVRDQRFAASGLVYQLVGEPALAGEVAISVSPRQPQLVERLNQAIEQLKRNGRFDRINTEFLPFRLQ